MESSQTSDDINNSTLRFNINIHLILSQSHLSNGVEERDYAQYRSYCTRRLSRLRHAKSVRRDLSFSSSGYNRERAKNNTKRVRGGRHAFHPRRDIYLMDGSKHVNYVLVLIYDAERAWAHSMELKDHYERICSSSCKSDGEKKRSVALITKRSAGLNSIKKHSLRRLARAVGFANKLEMLTSETCNNKTVLEARAYVTWMRGNEYMSFSNWELACKAYTSAMSLCKILSTDGEEGSGTKIFSSRVTDVIGPCLQYCQNKLNRAFEYLDIDTPILASDSYNKYSSLKLDFTSERKSIIFSLQSKPMSIISFRGSEIGIENEKLRLVLVKISSLKCEVYNILKGCDGFVNDEKRINSTDLVGGKFLTLICAFEQAATIMMEDIRKYENMISDSFVNVRICQSRNLLVYIRYQKLKLLITRNERVADRLREEDRSEHYTHLCGRVNSRKRIEEIAFLYDVILEDTQNIVTLLSDVDKDAYEQLEEDIILEALANLHRILSLRCYYIGRICASISTPKFQNAIALFEHALFLAKRAVEEIEACAEMERSNHYIQTMVDLGKEISVFKCRSQICSYLFQHGNFGSLNISRGTLLHHLNEFECNSLIYQLTDFPLSLKFVLCKPTFFDITNNIVYALPREELQKFICLYSQKKKKGILRWILRA